MLFRSKTYVPLCLVVTLVDAENTVHSLNWLLFTTGSIVKPIGILTNSFHSFRNSVSEIVFTGRLAYNPTTQKILPLEVVKETHPARTSRFQDCGGEKEIISKVSICDTAFKAMNINMHPRIPFNFILFIIGTLVIMNDGGL